MALTIVSQILAIGRALDAQTTRKQSMRPVGWTERGSMVAIRARALVSPSCRSPRLDISRGGSVLNFKWVGPDCGFVFAKPTFAAVGTITDQSSSAHAA